MGGGACQHARVSATEGRIAAPRHASASAGAPRAVTGLGLVAVAALIVVLRALNHLVPFVGPWPLEPGDPVDFAFRLVAYILWGAATLLALSRASTVRMGWLLLAITATDAIWSLQFIALPAFFYITEAFAGFSSIVLAHILVSFPTGTLTGRFDRRLIGGLYVVFLALAILRLLTYEPGYVCEPGEYCPVNPFALLPLPVVADNFGRITSLLLPVFGLLVAYAVVRHWRAAGPVRRRILLPLLVAMPFEIAYNVVWYMAQAYEVAWLEELIQQPVVNAVAWILPAGFLIGILRARAARTSLAGAVVDLGALPSAPQLEAVLRDRLGDPALQVVRWSSAMGAYLDADGRRVPVPHGGPRRLIELERDGEPVAGVVLDAALDDPGLEGTITGLIRLTVDATALREELRAHGGDVAGLPSGEVTFLFGDIEGSTRLLEKLGEEYTALLSRFRALATDIVGANAGRVVDARADELFCAFRAADDGLSAAVELQRRLAEVAWPAAAKVRVRVGLHTGRPQLTRTGYVGIDVHRAARVMAAASGGQILASGELASALAGDPGRLVSRGVFALHGLSTPTELFEVVGDGLQGTEGQRPPRAERVGLPGADAAAIGDDEAPSPTSLDPMEATDP
jgi:class 3 adenylate cyclase